MDSLGSARACVCTVLGFADCLFEAKSTVAETVENGLTVLFQVVNMGVLADVGEAFDVSTIKGDRNVFTVALLFLLLVLLVCLILFNLLIAIITNGFDDASANAKARVLLMRARLICNFEADLGQQEIKRQYSREADGYFPRYLHVLRPVPSQELLRVFQEHGFGRGARRGDGAPRGLLKYWSAHSSAAL